MSLLCRSSSGLVEGASSSVHRQSSSTFQFATRRRAFSERLAAMFGWAFFALLRAVPELSASCSWGALDDEEFFVIEGSGVALTLGVELPGVRPPVVCMQINLSAGSCGLRGCDWTRWMARTGGTWTCSSPSGIRPGRGSCGGAPDSVSSSTPWCWSSSSSWTSSWWARCCAMTAVVQYIDKC